MSWDKEEGDVRQRPKRMTLPVPTLGSPTRQEGDDAGTPLFTRGRGQCRYFDRVPGECSRGPSCGRTHPSHPKGHD